MNIWHKALIMLDPKVEALAVAQHEIWTAWAQNVILNQRLPARTAKLWQRMFVPYAELPEPAKEVARGWARQGLSALAAVGSGFKFEVDQLVRITDARMEARIVSRIEEKAQRMYRVLMWTNGERRSEVLPEDEIEGI